MNTQTHWETTAPDGKIQYIYITANSVVAGETIPNQIHGDAASSCSFDEFLHHQRFHDVITNYFGSEALKNIISNVQNIQLIPSLSQQRQRIQNIMANLLEIPIDPTLTILHRSPTTLSGSSNYGNAGFDSGYITHISGQTRQLEIKASQGNIVPFNPNLEPIPVTIKGNCEGGVSFDDCFFILNSQNFCVISAEGLVVFDTNTLREFEWGSTLRIGDVYLAGQTVFFQYRWFDSYDGKPGLIRYEINKGFTGRAEM